MNFLGIDFEDWYHPQLIQKHLKNSDNEPRMFRGIEKILEMYEKQILPATFFVVGKILESNPEIFDKIIENGHEIGFHTMNHNRIDDDNFKDNFQNEIIKFDKLTNKKSKGFRAPTFSLNPKSSWIIDSLLDANYLYDSSIVPAKTELYGNPNAEIKPYKISSNSLEKMNPNGKLMEFPICVTNFLGKKIPAGGGFYLRFLPKKLFIMQLNNMKNRKFLLHFISIRGN